MPGDAMLYQLAALSPLGAGIIIVVCWLVGARRTARIASTRAALDLLRRDFPEFAADRGALSSDGVTALLADAEGPIGLVFSTGDEFTVRCLRDGDVRWVRLKPAPGDGDDRIVHIRLVDPGAPRVRVRLARDKAKYWGGRVAALAGAAA